MPAACSRTEPGPACSRGGGETSPSWLDPLLPLDLDPAQGTETGLLAVTTPRYHEKLSLGTRRPVG